MSAVDTSPNAHITVPPPTVASVASSRPPAGVAPRARVRVGEDAFASEAMVDGWVRGGAAVRTGNVLDVLDGRRLHLRDAVRVLGRRDSDTDPYGFTGRVDPIRELIRRGANISADALRLGPAVYDIEYGYLVSEEG